ncbi:Bgt-2601 [Blumeria graminis f. sp. tritici]|uniref:Bgt-2601 n=2 Tax=Blumeria graminis f. sp. tritici TaxID=62690 RepID=A0A061HGY2_BLUGR|nr:epoxide hydrolase [Blumeria graminis f. sp. tritici 96224]VDB93474.1 Bgt-2601 [Blumeria graminis f. sp. tritici]
MADKITPTDPRIQWKSIQLHGQTYQYILAEPEGPIRNTVFLIHGWPDLAYGWRYQIPLFHSLGIRVVVPNMMGYGGTDAPDALACYTMKRAADDMAALAAELDLPSIILGGHDWGGAIAYRFALYHPSLIKAMFVVGTVFAPPRSEFIRLSTLPNFKYQIQLMGPEVESAIVGEAKLRQFFSAIFGGRTPTQEPLFAASHGVFLDRLDAVGPPPLLSEEELDFYVKSYARTGMRGPLNWYRTEELNFEDERALAENIAGSQLFQMPVLFIACSRDEALPPYLSFGMDSWFKTLQRAEVDSSHWALTETPLKINGHIKDFLTGTVKACL